MLWTHWCGLSSLFAGLGVGLGAFGAHALKARLSPYSMEVFEVGVRYQMYHALGLILVALMASRLDHWLITSAGWLFVVGILIFSGSLYALAWTEIKMWGAVTPLGGVCFLLGWLFLTCSAFKV